MILLSLPDWFTGFNFLMAALAGIVLIVLSLIVILARRGDVIVTTQKDRGDALDGLLKARTQEKEELQIKCDGYEEELEALTVEHRVLTGITVKDLLEFWAEKERIEADLEKCQRRCRVLEKQLDGPVPRA